MGKRKSLNSSLRNEILERDDNHCVKCGRYSKLEIHHIIPVVYGGQDLDWNLITLCHGCHKEAPDEPVDFFKWASKSLPPELTRSLTLTKLVVGILCRSKDKLKLGISRDLEDQHALYNWIESFYKDLWKVYVSNDMAELGKFFNNNFTPETEHSTSSFTQEDIACGSTNTEKTNLDDEPKSI